MTDTSLLLILDPKPLLKQAVTGLVTWHTHGLSFAIVTQALTELSGLLYGCSRAQAVFTLTGVESAPQLQLTGEQWQVCTTVIYGYFRRYYWCYMLASCIYRNPSA
jgi:hypothetical protein